MYESWRSVSVREWLAMRGAELRSLMSLSEYILLRRRYVKVMDEGGGLGVAYKAVSIGWWSVVTIT